MTRYWLSGTLAIVILICGVGVFAKQSSYKPQNGFIPDEKTAVRVGVAVLDAIYGEHQISLEEPFSAKLNNGIWTVRGTFPKGQRFGGVAVLKIAKKNGCIISVAHGM